MAIKKPIKYAAIVFGVFAVLAAGAIYYAAQKISADDIKKWTIAAIEKSVPEAVVSIETVDLSPGLNFHIGFQKFSMKLKNKSSFSKDKLIDVAHLSAEIPIWSVITGSGAVSIEVKKPLVFFEQSGKKNNWTHALGEQGDAQANNSSGKGSEAKEEVDLKKILRGNSLDLLLTDINIEYKLADSSKGNFVLSKFLMKNLNLNSETVFEIASEIDMKLQPKGQLQLELISVGQVNLSNYFSEKSVTGILNVEIKKLKAPGLLKSINLVKTDLDFNLKGDVVKGKIKSSADSFFKLDSSFEKNVKEMKLENISGSLVLGSLIPYLESAGQLNGASGSLKFNGQAIIGDKIIPSFTFSTAENIKANLDNDIKLDTKLTGTYKNYMFSVDSNNSFYGGNVQAKVAFKYDPNKKFEVADLGPVRALIWAKGIHLKKEFIRETLYSKDKSKQKSNGQKSGSEEKVEKSQNTRLNLPMVNVVVKWSDIRFDKEVFAGAFQWKGRGTKVMCSGCNFQFSKGQGSFNHTIDLNNPNNIKVDFISALQGLNLNSLKPFLPEALSTFEGVFTGNVNGYASSSGKYDVKVKVKAVDGEVKGNKIGHYIKDLIGNVPILSKKIESKDIKISDRFKSLVFDGSFTNAHYSIKRMEYVGAGGEQDVSIDGSGDLYPLNTSKRGIVDLNVVDKSGKIIKDLKKHIGTDVLPLRLKGFGLDLKPDYSYTIQKISKGALKTQGKKQAEKAIKKLFKEDKLKKVFKGLFK